MLILENLHLKILRKMHDRKKKCKKKEIKSLFDGVSRSSFLFLNSDENDFYFFSI